MKFQKYQRLSLKIQEEFSLQLKKIKIRITIFPCLKKRVKNLKNTKNAMNIQHSERHSILVQAL